MYANVNKGATSERLQKLAHMDPLQAAEIDFKLADPNTDYLANNGAALDQANNDDPITKARLRDALELFIGAEMESRTLLEKLIADAGISCVRTDV